MESNADLARQGIRIEWWSTAWMSVEFLVGVAAGVRAHSILLIAFGLDSLLEIVSGGALIWRLQKERSGAPAAVIDRAETRSSRIVGSVLLLLAGYIVLTSAYNLVTRQGADSSVPGLIIAVASLVLMPFFTLRKRQLGTALHSPALVEDGLCNITCAYMAGTVLLGAALTALFNWWWADSVAALVLVVFIVREGLEGVRGED